MKRSGNDAATRFGQRLRELMLQRGLASHGARSGVDVATLAQAAGATYEMARRYAEGAAIPRPEKLEAIARWLGVSPSSLAFGDAAPSAVDTGTLQQCIEAIIEAQARTGRTLNTEQAAHLVALLYSEVKAGAVPANESLDLLVRAAT